MRQHVITWTPARDAAFADLVRAWTRVDDLRHSHDFAARSEALFELQQARQAFRHADGRPVLAA